jgi:hypothetical protein
MGAWLARQRPWVREIQINYHRGRYYNLGPRRFASRGPRPPRSCSANTTARSSSTWPRQAKRSSPNRPQAMSPPRAPAQF